MSRQTADDLWGMEVVELALKEPIPSEVTADLTAEIRAHADPPGAFRAWALAQPWQKFCAIVRVVSGTVREEVETYGEG